MVKIVVLTASCSTYDVNVAELVQPEVVRSARRGHEVALCKLLVDLLRRGVELVQNPLLDQALLASRLNHILSISSSRLGPSNANLGGGFGDKRLVQLEHGKLRRVEDLVAELAVALYAQDLQVDVTACHIVSL